MLHDILEISERDEAPKFIGTKIFCIFFCFEWIVRFGAFRRKRDGLKDAWFVFDSVLVTSMVLETWVFTFIVFIMGGGGSAAGGGGNMGILRLA